MDTNYKLADIKTANPPELVQDTGDARDFGPDDTRSYVGPKGWIISRNESNKLWQMEHRSYPELTLTMLDIDPLPLGKHNWRINNNVCNQGITSIQTLLISGCKEEEFTCRDGQCVDMTMRCDQKFNCKDKSDEKGLFSHIYFS